ncbi:hypothetical protein [Streptomyces sp. NPDC005955]|uniref:hypothetical protein n=1 Tax=Streptomyces sp. NPDC005955 TaxID=3364738 RepID=UPI0036C852D3
MFLNDEGEVLPPASPLTFPPCTCGYPQCPDRPRGPEEGPGPDSPALRELRTKVRELNLHSQLPGHHAQALDD